MDFGTQAKQLLYKMRANRALNDPLGVTKRTSRNVSIRRDSRFSLLRGFRNLGVEISPMPSERKPVQVLKTTRQANDEGKKEEVYERRMEMLRKWKAQKLEQKKAERAKAKPLFKVCHVEHKPFVNIGAAYNSIKGVAVPNRVNSKVSAGSSVRHPVKPTNVPSTSKNTGDSKTILKSSVSGTKTGAIPKKATQTMKAKAPQREKTSSNTMTIQKKNETKVRKTPQRRSVKKASDGRDEQKSNEVNHVDAGRTPRRNIRGTKLVGSVVTEIIAASLSAISEDVNTPKKTPGRKTPRGSSLRVPKRGSSNAVTKNETKDRQTPQRKSVKSASAGDDAQKSDELNHVDAGRTPRRRSRAAKLAGSEFTEIMTASMSAIIEDVNILEEKTPKRKTPRGSSLRVQKIESNNTVTKNETKDRQTPQRRGMKRTSAGDNAQNSDELINHAEDAGRTPRRKSRVAKLAVPEPPEIIFTANTPNRTPGKRTPSRSTPRVPKRASNKKSPAAIKQTPQNNSNKSTPDNQSLNSSSSYVSPFVTVSRGKDNARKEYHHRNSLMNTPSGLENVTAAAHFQNRLDSEIARLSTICEKWSRLKTSSELPEEASDMVDVTCGQTNLLTKDKKSKFGQFRGLIENCRWGNSDPPVTAKDLCGFWDMIYVQVTSLDKRFENLERLAANNWEEILPEKPKPKKKAVARTKMQVMKQARKASSGLALAIAAARRNKVLTENNTDDVIIWERSARKTPRRSIASVSRTTSGRKSAKALTPAPGTSRANSVKSILKSCATRSTTRRTKSVLFMDENESPVKRLKFSSSDDD